MEPNTGAIKVRTGLVWAIEIGSEIAQLVKVDLDRRNQGGGPIICHPRQAVWVFLVRSDIPAPVIDRESRLWAGRVKVLEHGHQVALPSPEARGVFYRGWITATHSPYRPSGLAVLDSVRTVLTGVDAVTVTTRLPVMALRTA
ncbi:DNA-directed RNA polymerase subunit beta [Nocardia bovistercoris]|uniref:DNA-directed RNA polymerase subunit beta n=1 Tax=Nocardia bovistercoris TaxID=2785916 RepID=A0A931IFS9_9NOCA|nr:DNA-directed RNA polymerase subunit beta [Nocardia bovistercoris]MBH0780521.1 DNA-directed RNA polymerase subunit beta [Nocardia bovistercoris]